MNQRQGYLIAVNAETARNHLAKALNVARHTKDDDLIRRVRQIHNDVADLYADFKQWDVEDDDQ